MVLVIMVLRWDTSVEAVEFPICSVISYPYIHEPGYPVISIFDDKESIGRVLFYN
jgi:hypothetical protein